MKKSLLMYALVIAAAIGLIVSCTQEPLDDLMVTTSSENTSTSLNPSSVEIAEINAEIARLQEENAHMIALMEAEMDIAIDEEALRLTIAQNNVTIAELEAESAFRAQQAATEAEDDALSAEYQAALNRLDEARDLLLKEFESAIAIGLDTSRIARDAAMIEMLAELEEEMPVSITIDLGTVGTGGTTFASHAVEATISVTQDGEVQTSDEDVSSATFMVKPGMVMVNISSSSHLPVSYELDIEEPTDADFTLDGTVYEFPAYPMMVSQRIELIRNDSVTLEGRMWADLGNTFDPTPAGLATIQNATGNDDLDIIPATDPNEGDDDLLALMRERDQAMFGQTAFNGVSGKSFTIELDNPTPANLFDDIFVSINARDARNESRNADIDNQRLPTLNLPISIASSTTTANGSFSITIPVLTDKFIHSIPGQTIRANVIQRFALQEDDELVVITADANLQNVGVENGPGTATSTINNAFASGGWSFSDEGLVDQFAPTYVEGDGFVPVPFDDQMFDGGGFPYSDAARAGAGGATLPLFILLD